MKEKAITNLVVALALLFNAILTAMGKNPLPFDENEIAEMLAYFLSVGSTLWVWWKNNNISVEAATAQKLLDDMKLNRDDADGTGDPEDFEESEDFEEGENE